MLTTTLLLFCIRNVLGSDFHIKGASDFMAFSKSVNIGTSYSGDTVFLDNDIDFSGNGLSGQFEPIGKNDSISFQGTFDGQGYTISGLTMNSSSENAGLFGYTNGTLRNIVLDSSCTIMSSGTGADNTLVGGITWHCYECTAENSVNMASVAFTGNTTSALSLGGIAGYLYSKNSEAVIRNCANYGSVTLSGQANRAAIGGIAGPGGSSKHIQNCINYGTITYNGAVSSNELYIGGIIGWTSSQSVIENCVSIGKITSDKGYIGSILGYVDSGSTIVIHGFWTSDVGNFKVCGYGDFSYDSETSLITINATTVDNLNSYNSSWNKWLLNTDNKPVTFKVNNGKGFTLYSQLILLPSLAESRGHTFSGWFEDEECTKKFSKSFVDADTTLYGGWSYTVTFDFKNGTIAKKSVVYGQKYGELPTVSEKEGHSFSGWFTEDNTRVTSKTTVSITTNGHILYAHWNAHIKNASDLITFSESVNSGTSYSGDTVFLDNDIDFSYGLSEQFKPIGNENHSFRGTLDGQGYTISNLAVNSSSWDAGLFGATNGIIKNIVLDSSSSVVGACIETDNSVVGGIVGSCYECMIENAVNMGNAAFTGNISNSLSLGGIVGYFYAKNKEATIRNCANYGSVTLSGQTGYAAVGGIAGPSDMNDIKRIQNCLNYGTITYNGITLSERLFIGGIVGCSYQGTINLENCMSGGKIISSGGYVGSIFGYVEYNGYATHCYWTSNVGNFNASGGGNPTNVNETSLVTLNKTIMDSLNSYNSTWDRWFMLHLNGGKINSLSQEALIVTQKHFPEPVKEGNTFLFWCLDVGYNEQYDPDSTDITKVTDLYAVWNPFTLTFNYGNGTVVNKTLNYNETIIYPEGMKREGYTFNGWNPKPNRMPAYDITVTAQWVESPSEYVEIIFDSKEMTEEEIKAALKDLTEDSFTIEKIITDESGENKVIIRFTDSEKANDFVRKVNEGRVPEAIKRASMVPDELFSFNLKIKPSIAATTIIYFIHLAVTF